MNIATELVVLDSRDRAAATCIVCGNEIAEGEGVTISYGGRVIRLKCDGCFTRFQADPEPFLAGQPGGCCGGAHDHSPASEWA